MHLKRKFIHLYYDNKNELVRTCKQKTANNNCVLGGQTRFGDILVSLCRLVILELGLNAVAVLDLLLNTEFKLRW